MHKLMYEKNNLCRSIFFGFLFIGQQVRPHYSARAERNERILFKV